MPWNHFPKRPAPKPAESLELDVGPLVLRQRKRRGYKIDVRGSLQDAQFERTIEGASTLSLVLHDPDWALLESGMFDRDYDGRLDRIDTNIGPYWYRVVKLNPTDETLNIVLEDREVRWLRQFRKPIKRKRTSSFTRAEFIKTLLDEARKHGAAIDFYCPELHKKQPETSRGSSPPKLTPSQKRANSVTDDNNAESSRLGLSLNANLKVNGVKATREQLLNANIALNVAKDEGANHRAATALIAACIVESTLRNLSYGHSTSTGILQLLASTARGLNVNPRNVAACCRLFLRRGFWGRGGAMALARQNPNKSIGWIAQQCQGSAYPSRYDQHVSEAAAFVRAYKGIRGGGGSGDTPDREYTYTVEKGYYFTRGEAGKPEDSWMAIQRLAEEVGWRAYMDRGTLVVMGEEDLFRTRASYVIDRTDSNILSMSFDWDIGKKSAEMSLKVLGTRYAMAPGQCVDIIGGGPANGRWLVASTNGSLFSPELDVTLKKPIEEKPEPANEIEERTETIPGRGGGGGGSGGGGNDTAAKVYAAADRIHRRNLPYTWGGGHNAQFAPGPGYDCSGYVSACLHAGGLLGTPLASGPLESWGKPGKGRRFTVYANATHTFIHFYGFRHGRADTGGGPPSGPHLRHTHRSTAGFVARHWEGL